MSALFSLKGQRALVTGASRGLGKAIAHALAQAGASVICCSSQSDGAEKLQLRLRRKVLRRFH